MTQITKKISRWNKFLLRFKPVCPCVLVCSGHSVEAARRDSQSGSPGGGLARPPKVLYHLPSSLCVQRKVEAPEKPRLLKRKLLLNCLS